MMILTTFFIFGQIGSSFTWEVEKNPQFTDSTRDQRSKARPEPQDPDAVTKCIKLCIQIKECQAFDYHVTQKEERCILMDEDLNEIQKTENPANNLLNQVVTCANNPCLFGGKCESLSSSGLRKRKSYSCTCKPQFCGDNCEEINVLEKEGHCSLYDQEEEIIYDIDVKMCLLECVKSNCKEVDFNLDEEEGEGQCVLFNIPDGTTTSALCYYNFPYISHFLFKSSCEN